MLGKTLKEKQGFTVNGVTVFVQRISGKTVRLLVEAPAEAELKPRKRLDRRGSSAVK